MSTLFPAGPLRDSHLRHLLAIVVCCALGCTLRAGDSVATIGGSDLSYTNGADSDNAIGILASFANPIGIVEDSAGNLYVTDTRTVRRLHPTGPGNYAVSTIAGNPNQSGSSDNPQGPFALFNYLQGIAIDTAGNLYVVDAGNQNIRLLTPMGSGNYAVTTIAGVAGQAGNQDDPVGTAAHFSSPLGIAVDGLGNIYVGDTNNGEVRILQATGGGQFSVATLAAFAPTGMMCGNPAGGVYLTYGNQVMLLTPGSGSYSLDVIAGTGVAGESDNAIGSAASFNEPYAVAVDPSGTGNLYVTDSNGQTIRLVHPNGDGTYGVSTIAGVANQPGNGYYGTSREGIPGYFYYPRGITTDGLFAFVCDTDNDLIRRIALGSSYAQTVTMSPIPDQAYGASVNLAVLASSDSLLPLSFSIVSGPGSISGSSVVCGGIGTITVQADQPGNSQYAAAAPVQRTFTVNPAPLIVAAHDQYRDYLSSNLPTSYSITGFQFSDNFTLVSGVPVLSISATTSSPSGAYPIRVDISAMSVQSANYTLVAQAGVLAVAGYVVANPTRGGGQGIAVDAHRLLYVANGNQLLCETPTGQVISTTDLPSTIWGVALDAHGTVFVSCQDYVIHKLVPQSDGSFSVTAIAGITNTSGSIDSTQGASAEFGTVFGIAVDTAGLVYVNDSGKLRVLAPNGAGNYSVTTVAQGLFSSSSIAVDAQANVYAWAENPTSILRLQSQGAGGFSVSSIAGSTTTSATIDAMTAQNAQFLSGQSIAIDGAGDLVVEDYLSVRMLQSDGAGGYRVWTVAGPQNYNSGTTSGPGVEARFGYGYGIAIDNAGWIYVNDGGGTIREVVLAPTAQHLFFSPVPAQLYGSQVSLTAASDSALPVTLTLISGSATLAGTSLTCTGVGSITVQADAAGSSIFSPAASVQQTFAVNPVTLMITAIDCYRDFGAANPVMTYGVTGYQLNDTAALITAPPTLSTTATPSSLMGGYPIHVDTSTMSLSSANYMLAAGPDAVMAVAGVVHTVAGAAGQRGSADGQGAAAIFYAPYGVAVDAQRRIYVADSGNDLIRVITTDGNVHAIATSISSGGGPSPIGIALDASGNLYVAAPDYTVRKFAIQADGSYANIVIAGLPFNHNLVDNPVGTSARFWDVTGIAVDGSGNIFVNDDGDIRELTPDGTGNYGVTTLGGGLAAETSIAIDGHGALYGIASGSLAILRVVPDGMGGMSSSVIAGTGTSGWSDAIAGGNATFTNCQGVAVDATGNLYVSDGGAIRMLQPNGQNGYQVSTIAGSPTNTGSIDGLGTTARFSGTEFGLAVDAGGMVYIADLHAPDIRVIIPPPVTQSINFPALSSVTYGASPVLLSASASSFLPVSYAVQSGPGLVSGSTLTITGSGTIIVNATQAGDAGTPAASPQPQSLVVAPAPLAVQANSVSNVYGAAPIPVLGYGISGLIGADTANIQLGCAATVASSVGSYPITVTSVTPSNPSYAIQTTGATFTVTPASLAISAISGQTRTYGSPNPVLPYVVSGFVNGDGVKAGILTGALASPTATLTSSVGTYTITQGTLHDASGNYAVSYNGSLLTVTPAVLTVTATNVARSPGTANPVLTAIITGYLNHDSTSVVSGSPVLATSAITSSPPGGYPITVDASAMTATNYTFLGVPGTLSIGNTQQITFPGVPTQTYGQTVALQAIATSALPIAYTVISGPAFLNANLTSLTLTGIGTVVVEADQAGSSGLAAAAPVQVSFTVQPATLTVTPVSLSIPSGSAAPALTATITGFVAGDSASVVTGTPALSDSIPAGTPLGTYPITTSVAGMSAANYVFQTGTGAVKVVGSQTILFSAIPAQTYGSTLTLNATAGSGLAVAFSLVSGPATLTGSHLTLTGVGTVVIQADQAGGSGFGPAPAVQQSITVQPATITVAATSATQSFGTAIPALTYQLSGFQLGDAQALVSGLPVLATTATAVSAPAAYPITVSVSGLSLTNYLFVGVPGVLTITPATLTVVAISTARAYGATNPTLSYIAFGFAGGDTLAIMSGILGTPASSGSSAGPYPITRGTLSAGANYAVDFTPGVLTVTPATLYVAADAEIMSAGAAVPTLAYSMSGFISPDTASVVTGTPVLATTATSASPAGSYPITVSAAGLSASNYAFIPITGILSVTTAASAGSTAQAISGFGPLPAQVYGDATFTLTGVTGGGSGQPVLFISGNPAVATVSGSQITIVGAGSCSITATQAGDSSYAAATPVAETLTVAPAALTITATDKTFVAGGAVPALSAAYAGFVNGDLAASLTTPAVLSTTATSASLAGLYPITVSGATDPNYTITLVTGVMTVTAAPAAPAATASPSTGQGSNFFKCGLGSGIGALACLLALILRAQLSGSQCRSTAHRARSADTRPPSRPLDG